MVDSSLFAAKEKSPSALRTISEASEMLEVPQHVLRFWETKFHHIKPLKRNGGRRFYRPQDLEVLGRIKHLLYSQGYTIKGAKKAIDDFAHGRGEWLNTLPDANMNDNAPMIDDALAEIAEALIEVQAPVALEATPVNETPVALPELQAAPLSPAKKDNDELRIIREQIVEARQRLAAKLAA